MEPTAPVHPPILFRALARAARGGGGAKLCGRGEGGVLGTVSRVGREAGSPMGVLWEKPPPRFLNGGISGGTFARRVPGACPARHLCIKHPISSPKFVLTLGSPFSARHLVQAEI